jgi:short subunit dehydrogenase-like uncharacterized protein
MTAMNENVLVYGAYGHTGRFAVRELQRRGLTPVLAGRDERRLAGLADEFPGAETRTADVTGIAGILGDIAVVVNCAGPFLGTAIPPAAAAAAAGAHYLDVSAEQASVQEVYRAAREWGDHVAIVPALAFYGGLADLMATAAAGSGNPAGGPEPAEKITVVFGVDRWWPTAGTRETGRRNTAPRLVVAGGRLVPAAGRESVLRSWEFSRDGLGHQAVAANPFSEIIAMQRHLPASRISTYLTTRALDDVADPATGGPRAADDEGRSAQRSEVDVVVRPARAAAGERRIAGAGRDIYAFTGTLVAEAARWLADGRARVTGVAAPGEAFAAAEFLEAFSPRDLEIRWAAENAES